MTAHHRESRHRLIGCLCLLLAITPWLSACLDQQPDAMERSLSKVIGYAYNSDSPYAHELRACTHGIRSANDTCKIGTLPPLGYPDNEVPSVDQIMDRVLVSHDWMGDNFRLLLEAMPEDTRYLLRSVSAIVIHKDIRPAYYSSWRGMIAIDPNYLWLTVSQRNSINLAPDYRSDFGSDLQFDIPWRYVRDNDYAYQWVPVEASNVSDRSLDDILLAFSRLMYHELAHAVDFMQPGMIPHLNPGERWAYSVAHSSPFGVGTPLISNLLNLSSVEMDTLAGIRYWGEAASDTERSYLPDEVTAFFEPDSASHWYNYSTPREDLAMLFEAIMMKHHFNLDSDVAVTNKRPEGGTGDDMIVDWGQRNRMGEDRIIERMRWPLSLMLPELDTDAIFDGLPEPTPLVANASWHDNLDPETLSPEQAASKAQAIEDTRKHDH